MAGETTEETFHTGVSALVWRVLRESYLRFACQPRSPEELTVQEANTALDPHYAHLEHTHAQLMEAVEQAYHQGAQHVHGLLHSKPGVDNEMLDQAAEYAVLEGLRNDDGSTE